VQKNPLDLDFLKKIPSLIPFRDRNIPLILEVDLGTMGKGHQEKHEAIWSIAKQREAYQVKGPCYRRKRERTFYCRISWNCLRLIVDGKYQELDFPLIKIKAAHWGAVRGLRFRGDKHYPPVCRCLLGQNRMYRPIWTIPARLTETILLGVICRPFFRIKRCIGIITADFRTGGQ